MSVDIASLSAVGVLVFLGLLPIGVFVWLTGRWKHSHQMVTTGKLLIASSVVMTFVCFGTCVANFRLGH